MTGKQRFAVWVCAIYAVFWLGGHYSFVYTHNCLRSHTEDVIDSSGNDETVTVCDYYSANGRRWTFLDPVRSAYAVQGWIGLGIFGGVAVWIGWAVWSDRRERAEREQAAAQARIFS